MQTKKAPRWLFSPQLDILVGCGGWTIVLLPLAIVLGVYAPLHIATFFYAAALFCNYPHYSATLERAYSSPEERARYGFFTYQFAGFTLLALLLVHLYPVLMPYVFSLYLFWSPWHYSGQNFGIAMLFLRRAEISLSEPARTSLFFVFLSSYLLRLVALCGRPSDNPWVLSLYLRSDLIFAAELFFFFTCVIALGSTIWHLRGLLWWSAGIPVAVVITAQLLWFVSPLVFEGLGFSLFEAIFFSEGILAFMHCAQYLWITSYFAKRRTLSEKRSWSFTSYYAVLVLGGVSLFIVGPWCASLVFSIDLFQSLFIFTAVVNIHHFVVDGVIWKLRKQPVSQHLIGGGGEQQGVTRRCQKQPLPFSRRVAIPIIILGIVGLALIDQAQSALARYARNSATLEVLYPHDTRIILRKAQYLLHNGEIGNALQLVDNAIALNPYSFPAQSLKGDILIRLGSLEESFHHYRSLVDLFAPVPSLLFATARVSLATDRAREAVTVLEQILKRDPTNIAVVNLLAESAQKAGLVKEQSEYLTYNALLLAAQPDNHKLLVPVLLSLGSALEKMGKLKDAALRLKEAELIAEKHRMTTDLLFALVQEARLALKVGFLEDASTYLDRAQPLAEELADAGKQAVVFLLRGDLAFARRDLNKARELFTKGLAVAKGARLPAVIETIEGRLQVLSLESGGEADSHS